MIISLTGFMACGKSSVGKQLCQALLSRSVDKWEYIDLDDYIEEKAGSKIPDIFAKKGEKHFRDLEFACLTEIIEHHTSSLSKNLVLSLGGGTPLRKNCAKLIKEQTTCIYLEASPEEILKNLIWGGKIKDLKALANRPLLVQQNKESSTAFLEDLNDELLLERLINNANTEGAEDNKLNISEKINILINNLRERIEELMEERISTYEHIACKNIFIDGLSPSQIVEKLLSSKIVEKLLY